MNECLTTPRHEKQIGYWVSKKGKRMKWLYREKNEWVLNDTPAHNKKNPDRLLGCQKKVNAMKWLEEKKEGRKFLFNDALNSFNLRLYGVRHMVKDHLDSERGNLLLPHGLLFLINSKGSSICTIPQTGYPYIDYQVPQPLLNQPWSTGWNEK